MARIRKVRTASGATAVQIVRDVHRRTVVDYHVGSAHNEIELHALLKKARDLLYADQLELDLELPVAGDTEDSLTVESMTARVLLDVFACAWSTLGFDAIYPVDSVFARTVFARVVQPSSKSQVPMVLQRLGLPAVHRNTVSAAVKTAFDEDKYSAFSRACFDFSLARGTVAWVLYDVTTLYFEADREDDLRKVGYSKERRIDPQVVVGLLVDSRGLPLEISCFEGNKAEALTMIDVLNSFRRRHNVENIIVVADAGMISADNCNHLEALGFQFIIGARMSKAPYKMDMPINETGHAIDDGHIVESTKTMGPSTTHRTTRRMVCQYSHKRFANDKHTLAKQRQRAEEIVTGTRKQKRARFVTHTSGRCEFNTDDFEKASQLAGWKGYITNISAEDMSGEQIIATYHDLYEVERSFRMAKSDLQARPMYVRKEDSIRAHLNLVFVALAVARFLQDLTGFSRQKIINILEPLRDVTINTPHGPITIPTKITPEAQEILNKMSY